MKRWVMFLGTAAMALPTLADNAALLRCRTIAEGPARLACYDAIALPGLGSRAGWGAPLPGAAAPAAPAAAPGATAALVSPVDQFGLEGKAQASGGPLDALVSTIPGRFQGWGATTQFRLANGQVWAIADRSSAFYNLQDPKVTLRKGLFDAIYLEVEGVNQRPLVKRIR